MHATRDDFGAHIAARDAAKAAKNARKRNHSAPGFTDGTYRIPAQNVRAAAQQAKVAAYQARVRHEATLPPHLRPKSLSPIRMLLGFAAPLIGLAGGLVAAAAHPALGAAVLGAALATWIPTKTKGPVVDRHMWWGQWWPAALLWSVAGFAGTLALIGAVLLLQALAAIVFVVLICSAWLAIKRF